MAASYRILVADEGAGAQALRAALEADGHRVQLVPDGKEALSAVQAGDLDLLIADLVVPGANGFDFLTAALEARPDLPVILMSEYGTIETAVQALKQGAHHYFQKPLDMESLRGVIAEACNGHGPRRRTAVSRPEPADLPEMAANQLGIVGRGPWLDQAVDVLRRVAPTRTTVLLTGASGTGKELFARATHRLSGRKGPFVAVSCAALSRDLLESELFGHEKGAFTGADRRREGRFELAHSGTLFLDEIGEVPLDLQVKLLRVLQERSFERVGGSETLTVDVRIVAATNRNLAVAIQERLFREDLYYRLKVIEITLPPLRERPQDVELLARHFIHTYSAANGKPRLQLEAEALRILQCYSWPGNVRELENVIERAVVLAEPWDTTLTGSLLPTTLSAEAAVSSAPAPEPEPPANGGNGGEGRWLNTVAEALQQTGGNATEAAKVLGISPRSVRYYADRAGLVRRRNRQARPLEPAAHSGTNVAVAWSE